MKQTVAELGVGGEGWIIYNDFVLPMPKRVAHIEVVNNWYDNIYMMPQFLLREFLESEGTQTTRDLIVFANEIVYSTKEEAEAELLGQVSNTITSIEQKNVDWKKLLSELDSIQKQFSDITEDQKKDACTLIKKLKNIANPQPDNTDWNQVRISTAISVLNALLETANHNYSVLGKFAEEDMFIKTAVGYADKLVYELKRSEALFEEKLKEI